MVYEKKYFSIQDVVNKTNIPAYTIRYWETKFHLLRPLRLASGHRRYTQADIETLLKIKDLVLVKGYTLSGARKAISLAKRKAGKTIESGAYGQEELLEQIRRELVHLIKDL